MKGKLYLMGLSVCVTFFACKNKTPKVPTLVWDEITIRTDNQDIRFSNDTAVCYSQTWTYKDSMTNDGESWRIPTGKKLVSFRLTKSEKDSMYSFISELIDIPHPTSTKCSDYVGNVIFKIYYQQYSKSCSYSSVCKWQNLNTITLKISNLLRTKVELINE